MPCVSRSKPVVDAPMPVQGALCFTHADPPLLRTVEMRSHLLIYRRALTTRLTAPGAVDSAGMKELASAVATALHPA